MILDFFFVNLDNPIRFHKVLLLTLFECGAYNFVSLRTFYSVNNVRKILYVIGQLIFASEANGDFILLAAWWPWANGTIISMRIGLYSTGKTPLCRDEAARCLREWLGVGEAPFIDDQ